MRRQRPSVDHHLVLDDLRIQYRDLTGFSAPMNLRSPLLKRLIEWHLACIEKGIPSREAFYYRTELVREIRPYRPSAGDRMREGSVLIREHNGRTHIVRKGGNGQFYYAGRCYRSLTAVAFAITGIHRSGPRFFKLVGKGGAAQ